MLTDDAVDAAVNQWLAALATAHASPQTVRHSATVVRDFRTWSAYPKIFTFERTMRVVSHLKGVKLPPARL